MDRFYREVRRETGILMEDGKPVGGKYSFDTENRKRWPGEPAAPTLPEFSVDDVKAEVIALVEEHFGDHPGQLDPTQLPATQADADQLWKWALDECLPLFGPYEDAMSDSSASLFHSRASALINNGRLLPARVIEDVLALDIPLASQEGFVRQVIGWREFMRHVHSQTNGFRTLAADARPNLLRRASRFRRPTGGSLQGSIAWIMSSDEVWRTGYGHHITRLMVLSNLATLLGVEPREVADWFWVAYVDAYDWVVEPNVLGMGTFALGDLFMTKPYVSGSAYIHRMSDYCKSCAFLRRRIVRSPPSTGISSIGINRHWTETRGWRCRCVHSPRDHPKKGRGSGDFEAGHRNPARWTTARAPARMSFERSRGGVHV